MLTWFRSLLVAISGLLIDPTYPDIASSNWTLTQKWLPSGNALTFTAESETIPRLCAEKPDYLLYTADLIQGFHEFYVDGRLILKTGDRTFKQAASMHNVAELPCYMMTGGKKLTWKAITISKSYAHIYFWPELADSRRLSSFFFEYLPPIAFGVLLLLAVICWVLFGGKAPNSILTPFLGSLVLFAVHFLLTTPDSIGISLAPYYLHRLHDIILWVGTVFLFKAFQELGFIGRGIRMFHLSIMMFCCMVIALAGSLDQGQIGSNLAFVANTVILSVLIFKSSRSLLQHGSDRRHLFQLTSIIVFTVTALADMGTDAKFWYLIPLYPIGVMACLVTLAFVVNEDILSAYKERDYLRGNLQKEVDQKTADLREANDSLQKAYMDLKVAQAEIVQSAKMASLGTLAAGIAHEINNALNYVRGAIGPLEQITIKEVQSDGAKNKATKLLQLMKEGLQLTFDIISNLKRHAFNGTVDLEQVELADTVKGVLLLLKHRVGVDIEVKQDIAPGMSLYANKVGLTQIVMNLIGNAIDALMEKRQSVDFAAQLLISARQDASESVLIITDNGLGMPEAVQSRIFEPFYTTKEVGKGTGLGLHLVRKEMDAVGGKILVTSELGKGTTFQLIFPVRKASTPQEAGLVPVGRMA